MSLTRVVIAVLRGVDAVLVQGQLVGREGQREGSLLPVEFRLALDAHHLKLAVGGAVVYTLRQTDTPSSQPVAVRRAALRWTPGGAVVYTLRQTDTPSSQPVAVRRAALRWIPGGSCRLHTAADRHAVKSAGGSTAGGATLHTWGSCRLHTAADRHAVKSAGGSTAGGATLHTRGSCRLHTAADRRAVKSAGGSTAGGATLHTRGSCRLHTAADRHAVKSAGGSTAGGATLHTRGELSSTHCGRQTRRDVSRWQYGGQRHAAKQGGAVVYTLRQTDTPSSQPVAVWRAALRCTPGGSCRLHTAADRHAVKSAGGSTAGGATLHSRGELSSTHCDRQTRREVSRWQYGGRRYAAHQGEMSSTHCGRQTRHEVSRWQYGGRRYAAHQRGAVVYTLRQTDAPSSQPVAVRRAALRCTPGGAVVYTLRQTDTP